DFGGRGGGGGANPKIGWQQQILNLEVYLKSMELVREQIITALEDLRSSSVVECGISLCMYYNIPICILGSSLAAGSCP
ncbi:Os10g0198333, partial [Oryza sativa Japonica Group]